MKIINFNSSYNQQKLNPFNPFTLLHTNKIDQIRFKLSVSQVPHFKARGHTTKKENNFWKNFIVLATN
jgi:hypothetical protein